MSDSKERKVLLPAIAGAALGFLLMGCCGGPAALSYERKHAADLRKGWNLMPVVVASHDFPPGTKVSMEDLVQRSLPEQFVTSSIVKPESVSYIVGQPCVSGAKAGDVMLWSAFETSSRWRSQCSEVVERAAARRGADGSEGLNQLVGALRISAKSWVPERGKR